MVWGESESKKIFQTWSGKFSFAFHVLINNKIDQKSLI